MSLSKSVRRRQKSPFDDEDGLQNDDSKYQSFKWQCLQLSMSSLCGVIFGFALEKGRVFEPQVIRDQMTFSRFIMLKMFLSASATSMLCLSILTMLPVTHQYIAQASRAFTMGFDNKGMMTSIVGGSLLGVGMTLGGACPGMVLAQVGAGTGGAVVTLLGGLCGVVLYGLVEPAVVRVTRPPSPITQHFAHQHLGGTFFNVALPCVAVMGTVLFAVELYAPWTSEVPTTGEGFLTSLSWPPYFAGIVIGLLQIPVVIFNKDTLGSSSAYCTVMSQCCRVSGLQKFCPYLSRYSSGVDNWWQVIYVGSAIAGAYLSATLSSSVGQSPGVSPVAGFVGGACMLFGSRLAAGCTSGHGLSGLGLLSVLSMVTVPAMFAGGIASAFGINML